jgi:2-polyprenyl-3-methyl-5-hydroxy-6-metoxy-1,4-benzoquinol methylase
MNRLLAWPLTLSLYKRDGYEPTELFGSLSWLQRMSRSAFWPITLPALLDKRIGAKPQLAKPPVSHADQEATLHILKSTLAGLRRRTRRALPKDAASSWSEYQDTLTHYTSEQSAEKRAWVQQVLEDLHPARVLDLGANTGEFSALAASAGAQVVAMERDAASAERLFCMSRARNLSITTIHADLARPTPAAGWENAESLALLPRLEGQFDLVLMLAVIHHLILMEQIPLPAIVALCHRLTQQYLAIEWVPSHDPMYLSLMRGRESLYGGLSEADLLAACIGHFQLLQQQTLTNGRILFLFEKENKC